MCNLASIAVNMYVDEKKKTFDFAKFREVIKVMVRNLNRIIDINYYPVDEVSGKMLSYPVFKFSYIFLTDLTMFFFLSKTHVKYSEACLTLTCTYSSSCFQARRSNMRHRPIGLGVQGLADAFILMRFPFDSPQAQQLNKEIFEHLYFAALDASCELAERDGPYETYEGSPVSQGVCASVA